MTGDIEPLAAAIADAESVVALTGAGVSTASGIPDFRGEDGLWEKYDPAKFHYSRFKTNPEEFWERRVVMHEDFFEGEEIAPNAAHEALATLERRGFLDAVITQNVDGLHSAAGSQTVIELHGNADSVVCEECNQRFPAEPVRERVAEGEGPPHCEDCDAILKPDVVLFGEQLPQEALFRAREAARQASVFLTAGSSLEVEPAASLPRTARQNGGTLAVVNLEETPVSGDAEYDFREDVTETLPRLVDALFQNE